MVPSRAIDFSLPKSPDRTVAHLTSYSVGTWGSCSGGKTARTWRWHSLPSSAEVRNVWTYNSKPSYALMTCTGTILF